MKNKILSELANNQSLKDYAFKVSRGNDLWKDVLSEMTLYIAEMDEEKLLSLYKRDELNSYCFKIIWLSINSKTSPFYKKYLKKQPEIEANSDNSFDYSIVYVSDRLDELERESKKYPTAVKLFREYIKLGSYTEVAKKCDIPVKTVWNIIQGIKHKI